MLGPGAAEHPACQRSRLLSEACDRGSVQHRHRHPGEPLGGDDVIRGGAADRVLVGLRRPALVGGDEARAELRARVPDLESANEVRLIADTACADQRHPEVLELHEQLSLREAAEMAARVFVDRDQSVDAGPYRLLRETPLGGIVIHRRTHRVGLLDDPLRIAERGHEEPDAFFQGDVDPLLHPAPVGLGGGLDERVHADGLPAGQAADEAQSLAEVVAVDVGEGDGLHDAQAAGRRHRRDQLGVAARVHRAADEGRFHPGVGQEALNSVVVQSGCHRCLRFLAAVVAL